MFLKSLDIFGFKSFADKTHIEFADGITALLGPNGCGKSNVVDAVKWVLAENKAKNLRADTMESVIFNGTETRPPLNIAEVTLTLANENGLLPLDDTEIALKRRLYRSGENEYYINNKQVGPTEVRRLFMDTGVGKAAYSVMEQGKIDQILSSKPEDRRYLFEEAAGISRSKAEVAEARRDLERTQQNLDMIEVSLAENKRSYETLKVQSEKTLKYRALKEDIFNFELDIQLLKLKDFVQNQARQTQAKEEIAEKRNAVQAEIDEILNTLTENSDKIKELQAKMGELQMELVRIQTEKTNKLDQQKILNENARTIREKIGTLELKQRSIQERIDELNEEIANQDADLRSKSKQIEEVKQNIDSFVKNIESSQNQITTNEQKITESEEEIRNLDTERENFQKELEAITEDIVTELDAKLKDSGFSSAASKKAKEDLDSLVGKLKVYAEGRRNIFTDYASLKGHSDEENENFAKDAIKALDEVAGLVKEIEGAVQTYSETVPNFIDEFLSPEGIITKKRNIDRNIQENLQKIATIRERIDGYKAENILLIGKINEYKETLSQLRVSEAQMQQQIFNAKQTADLLKRNLTGEQNALRQNEQDLYLEQKNQEDLEERISDLDEALGEIERHGRECAETMGNLDEEIKRCNTSVSGKKNALDKKREEQQKYQSQYEKLTLDLVTSENDIRNIKQNFIETHSRDLMEFEERMYKINTPSVVLREKLSSSRKALADLGSVNLMAPEEFGEQKERYEKLQKQYEDTVKARADILRVYEEIKTKSTEMFVLTYNKIKKNFHNMFRRLFGGGRAELRLTDPQNVLTSGVDIYAEPPGKKLQNIALLSGGEKTMTAVALLFATYQVRPSPFCLLDEIDAALDDKNVTSFVQALRSFAKLSQYIVITHNKKTVMGASTMLGVTMQESGVSKVITISLDKSISKDDSFDETEEFIEEDVPEEEGVVVPPRPEPRIHNADGTITDPIIEKYNEEQKEAAKRARAEAKAAKAAEEEAKQNNSEAAPKEAENV
ncbi:chromosome segregation protein SMC [Treponema ruminis]|uniref:Chromosome partition protein Smc n=2 Tax=Treponema TaxID=157 RepID=A0A7W8LLP8_9SPIR|nr:AAA family ATPase [Treponema ruminis]MBB5225649.1 chromosome segregation protein [Treponema ruminis]QSI02338.1 chromosome segregation protein SMC [Treponema ruminis]